MGIVTNLEMRHFQDELNHLVNLHKDLPWECRLLALELITMQVQKLADDAIIGELKEKEECKKPTQE